MSLRIELDTVSVVFAPGGTIAGTAIWELPRAPERLELRLFWRTDGRGDPDVVLVDTLPLPAASAGRQGFRFVLPAGPWSFRGPLIHLVWAIELVAEPTAEAARVDFTLSPVGGEIQLQPAPPDAMDEKIDRAVGRAKSFFERHRA
ncbi:MAG: hypothetical protein ACM3OB_10700 [Acidobacteriota bacterium]